MMRHGWQLTNILTLSKLPRHIGVVLDGVLVVVARYEGVERKDKWTALRRVSICSYRRERVQRVRHVRDVSSQSRMCNNGWGAS